MTVDPALITDGSVRRETLREALAGRLHETRGLLAGDVLIFEDCLTLAEALLAGTSIVGGRYTVGGGWQHIVVEFPVGEVTGP